MPTRFNTDHQHQILDGGVSVPPGEPHEFTKEELAAGVAGQWSDEDPRAGLEAERAFKRKRDSREADPAAAEPAADPDDPKE